MKIRFFTLLFFLFPFFACAQNQPDGNLAQDSQLEGNLKFFDSLFTVQVNANSPFLPGHGDVVIWGASPKPKNESVAALLNGICGVDSYVFYNEQSGSELLVYYIGDGLSKELYRDMIFSLLCLNYGPRSKY